MTDLSRLCLDDDRLDALFGAPSDSMPELAARATALFVGVHPIVWEGDPATFRFSYVSPSAELVLGYPAARWCEEPTFWADVVVFPADRDNAIAYCALATAKRRDHRFEYRARAADGRIVWLHDLVRVLKAPSGIPASLRGVMFDITQAKVGQQDRAAPPSPTRDQLDALA